jgi:DNA-binding transcriptional regulator YiaG
MKKISRDKDKITLMSSTDTPSSPSSLPYQAKSKLVYPDRKNPERDNLISTRSSKVLSQTARSIRENAIQLAREIESLKRQYEQVVDQTRKDEAKYKESEESMLQRNKMWRKECEMKLEYLADEMESKLRRLDSQKQAVQEEYQRRIRKGQEGLRAQAEKFDQYVKAKREAYMLECFKGNCNRGEAIRERLELNQKELARVMNILESMNVDLSEEMDINKLIQSKNRQVAALRADLGSSVSV